MSTNAIVQFLDGPHGHQCIAEVYSHYDGGPHGMGNALWNVLNLGRCNVVQGYASGDHIPSAFNGMGCLAAYAVGMLKQDQIGYIYLQAPSEDPWSKYVDYVYTITTDEDGWVLMDVEIKLGDTFPVIWSGPISRWDAYEAQEAEDRLLDEIRDFLEEY